MEIYIYNSAESYNNENPEVTVDIEAIKVDGKYVELITSDGYEHKLFNFFAITFKSKEVYEDTKAKSVYIYTDWRSYDKSNPNIELLCDDKEVIKEKFITLYNEYVHILNAEKICAFVREQEV